MHVVYVSRGKEGKGLTLANDRDVTVVVWLLLIWETTATITLVTKRFHSANNGDNR